MTDTELGGYENFTLLSGDESSRARSIDHASYKRRRSSWNLAILAANIAVLLVSLIVNLSTWSGNHGSDCIMPTDMLDARSAIQYEQRVYTGALTYDTETKRMFREQDSPTEYFGYPSQEINDAWRELLHGMLDQSSRLAVISLCLIEVS